MTLKLAGAALVSVFSMASVALGHSTEYIIDFWDAENGLPANSATALAQTHEGYLWIGTYTGLARFDGVRFVIFDPSNTPALKHARIERLFVDATGTLFINTHDGSLTSWRRGVFTHEWEGRSDLNTGVWLISSRADEQLFYLQTGAVIRRTVHEGKSGSWTTIRPPGSAFRSTYCTAGSGEAWICSDDRRLWRLSDGRVELVAATKDLAGREIRYLSSDINGRVWVGTESELAVWDKGAFRRMTPENGESRLDVTFLMFTRDGGHWTVANRRLRKAQGRRWIPFLKSAQQLSVTPSPPFIAHEDREGGIWFGCIGVGLLHIRRDGSIHRFSAADGFVSARVKCLIEDHEGNIWVSVDRGGLARIRARRFQRLNPAGRSTPHAVISVCEDRQGSIWIGTLGGGLTRWRDGATRRFPLPAPASRQSVFAVFPDEHDRLWLSADFEDLWILERERLRRAPWPLHGVKTILVDRLGRIWFGRKDGLSCWTGERIRSFTAVDGIDETDVRALAQDGRGAIWVGSGDGTIYRFHNGAFERYRTTDIDSIDPIWSLSADSDGTVWAGTYRGGLLRLKDSRFTRFTTRDGLLSDDVCQIIDDEQGNLWLGSREGVSRLSKASLAAFSQGRQTTLTASHYGRSDGLPPLECSGYQPSSWRGRDGRLLFATIRGVIHVHPRDLTENRTPPAVVIEEVLVDGKPHDVGTILDQEAVAHPGATLIIPPGKQHLEFRYTGLSLSAPDKVRFRYRLEKLDHDWIEAGGRRTSQYNYLRPGEYRFRVIACNNDGVWNEAGASLNIKLLPHFWQTSWFKGLLGLAMMSLVAGAVRSVTSRRLRRETERLERQRAIEHDRTRIAKDIHDDLGAGLTQISLLSELARGDGDTVSDEHLEQIFVVAHDLIGAMDEIVWAINPANDTLDNLWNYLSGFAQELLERAGIQCRLQAPEELPSFVLTPEVRHNVFLAAKEALNNAVKHARAREVFLRLVPTTDAFVLIIMDDGQGFDPDNPTRSLGNERLYSGQGLKNMIQRLASLGGKCEIHSRPGEGTQVEMTVQLR